MGDKRKDASVKYMLLLPFWINILWGTEVFPHPFCHLAGQLTPLSLSWMAQVRQYLTSWSPAPLHLQTHVPAMPIQHSWSQQGYYLRVMPFFARERLICYLFWKTPSGSYMPVKKSSCLWGNVLLGPGSVCKCALEAEERLVTDPSSAGRAAAELRTSYKLVQHLKAHFLR